MGHGERGEVRLNRKSFEREPVEDRRGVKGKKEERLEEKFRDG